MSCLRPRRSSRSPSSARQAGGRCRSSTGRTWCGSAMSTTMSSRGYIGAPMSSRFRLASRASGFPSSRRWRAACRSSRRRTRRSTRPRATRRCALIRTIPPSGASAFARRASGATSSSREASSTSRAFRGGRPGRRSSRHTGPPLRGCDPCTSGSMSRRSARRGRARRGICSVCFRTSSGSWTSSGSRGAAPAGSRPSRATRGGIPSRCRAACAASTYSTIFVPRVARAAQRVIALSEFMKRELVERLGLDEGRVRVVPPAVDEPFGAEGARADGDYVLAVGTLEPRKNLPRLAAAARAAGVELRIAGGHGWGDVDLGGDGVQLLGFVSDEELARLYRGALCVAYTSVYEGFGIPVLEALACGAPVVTSAGTAMAEVADGAAVLVDPLDADAIAAGLAEAIARRDELAALGPQRARRFTWQASAEATAAVYRELA